MEGTGQGHHERSFERFERAYIGRFHHTIGETKCSQRSEAHVYRSLIGLILSLDWPPPDSQISGINHYQYFFPILGPRLFPFEIGRGTCDSESCMYQNPDR